jgi:hypothetical protein
VNIEQKELINIIREELAEALGMDASYDRQNLTMKLRDFLDEYTGDDLQAAMDVLENVQAMLRYEMNMAAKEDEELNEDFFSDSAEEESAEADEEAAETSTAAPYVTGQGSGVKEEGSCGEPKKYFKLK